MDFDRAESIPADVVDKGAHRFRVARQRREGNSVLGGKIGKAIGGGEAHAVTGFLQPERQRGKRLHVAARAVGEDGDFHGSVFNC